MDLMAFICNYITEYIFKSDIFREIDFRVRHKSINSEIITGILIIALCYSFDGESRTNKKERIQ